MKRLLIFSLLLIPLVTFGSGYSNLQGKYYIGGKTVYDPPKGEPQNTHMYFELHGKTAMDMFQIMKGKAEYDECRDDGSRTKSSKNIQCTQSKDRKTYICYFSLNPSNEKLGIGIVC